MLPARMAGLQTKGTLFGGLLMPDVFIICLPGSEEHLEGLLSSRGDGALWQCRCPDKGRGSPGELLLSEERRHLESEAKPCWDCCTPIPQPLSLPSLCCPAAGMSTASPAGLPCSKGRKQHSLSAHLPAQNRCKNHRTTE